jgi:hypothetical protein
VPGKRGSAERHAGWDDPEVVDHPQRPDLSRLRLPADRREHVLARHRSGAGWPGRTEFPSEWSDSKIANMVIDAAAHPGDAPVFRANARWAVRAEREGVAITVVVRPDGVIWTAYPRIGGPGVVKNR